MGGVFKLGNPEGRGAQARRGGVDFFWNNPLLQVKVEGMVVGL